MPVRYDLPPTTLRGPRAVPLLGPRGNLLALLLDPVRALRALHERHGNLVALADRSPSLVCAFGAEHNRRVLTDTKLFQNMEDGFFEFPTNGAVDRVLHGLPLINGDLHRRHRRLLMPAFNRAVIDGYRDDMAAITERRLEHWRVGRVFDVAGEMIDLTLGIALKCLFGLDAGEGEENIGTMTTAFISGLTSPATALFPRDVPGTPYARFVRLAERLEAETRALIRRKRRAGADGNDVLSILVRAHDEDGATLTDDELLGESSVMLVAGHETTAYTLAWTLFLLSQHPRVFADLADEVHGLLRGAAPTTAQLAELPLLDGVVKESMRLLPAVGILFVRYAQEDCALGGHTLPRGSGILLSPLMAHRIPEVFPEPYRFRPERWRGFSPSPYEYIPFGAGPRLCIGAGFASLVVRVVLAQIVQRYRLTLSHDTKVGGALRGVTFGPAFRMPMLLAPRDGYYPRPAKVRGPIHRLVDLS